MEVVSQMIMLDDLQTQWRDARLRWVGRAQRRDSGYISCSGAAREEAWRWSEDKIDVV